MERIIVLTPWLEHLQAYFPIAREGSDPEGVHQMRVAIRRLRVWLELADLRVLEDDLAWWVQSAGKVRDLEVLLGQAIPKPFARWLEKHRSEARVELLTMLDSPRVQATLQALSVLPPLKESKAHQRLKRFEQRMERRTREWQQADTLEALHALRRAIRRLRYARECLGQDVSELKQLQEILGVVGDQSFALEYLSEFEAETGQTSVRFRRSLERGQGASWQRARQVLRGQGAVKRKGF